MVGRRIGSRMRQHKTDSGGGGKGPLEAPVLRRRDDGMGQGSLVGKRQQVGVKIREEGEKRGEEGMLEYHDKVA